MPFDPYSTSLYTPDELYAGYDPAASDSYERTPDRIIYLSAMDPVKHTPLPVAADIVLLRRMHDATVSEALDGFVAGRQSKIVAIMGGHEVLRTSSDYLKVATLALRLTQAGFIVASGGGPGLMEAAARSSVRCEPAAHSLGR